MRNGSFQYGAAVLLLSAAAAAAAVAYGVTPLARRGLSFESDVVRAAEAASRSAGVYSYSDWVFADDSGRLVLTRLTPALARRLGALRVSVTPLRDLPGLLPILLLAGVGVAGLRASRVAAAGRARDWVVLLMVAAAAAEFYIWLWTVAADFDLTTPLKSAGAGPPKPRDTRLDLWRNSVPFQTAVWLAAMVVLCKLVWDGLGRAFVTLVIAAFYLALASGVFVMFRPDPYFRFPVLSWWPLLFSLAVLLCGVSCVRAAHRLAARAPEASDEIAVPS